jgi:hypothetical protein
MGHVAGTGEKFIQDLTEKPEYLSEGGNAWTGFL